MTFFTEKHSNHVINRFFCGFLFDKPYSNHVSTTKPCTDHSQGRGWSKWPLYGLIYRKTFQSCDLLACFVDYCLINPIQSWNDKRDLYRPFRRTWLVKMTKIDDKISFDKITHISRDVTRFQVTMNLLNGIEPLKSMYLIRLFKLYTETL